MISAGDGVKIAGRIRDALPQLDTSRKAGDKPGPLAGECISSAFSAGAPPFAPRIEHAFQTPNLFGPEGLEVVVARVDGKISQCLDAYIAELPREIAENIDLNKMRDSVAASARMDFLERLKQSIS